MFMAPHEEADRCIVALAACIAGMAPITAVIGMFAANTGNVSVHHATTASTRSGSERRMDGRVGCIGRV
ncbi:hypothetical protein GCM10010981_04350 [Dyella nitratireducens]|uniref:Uncharacterized protein n=1 Tax=Dyella nitratireducens TaxID=1849580 RepID=A0ABQ1FL84_9GAMM|nr:hypothetical protein GCM10010981_04350 [Dyella nitratireducens]GLQ44504.1 hypothetical protein GCM10007902_43540 [Dyella nitratireducens]